MIPPPKTCHNAIRRALRTQPTYPQTGQRASNWIMFATGSQAVSGVAPATPRPLIQAKEMAHKPIQLMTMYVGVGTKGRGRCWRVGVKAWATDPPRGLK